MAELETIRKELEQLLKEVKSLQTDAAGPAAPDARETEPAPQAEPDADALAELQNFLVSKAGEAESTIEDHPLAAMAAAFLLGLTIGRIALR